MTWYDQIMIVNETIFGAVMLIVGLAVCFFGAKYFKSFIFLLGFIFGSFGAYLIIQDLSEMISNKDNIDSDILLYMSLICGCICGALCVLVYKAAIFTCGAIAGGILSQIIFNFVSMNFEIPHALYVRIGLLIAFVIIGGFLAFKFVEIILKGLTAFIGAFMFSSAVAYFAQRFDSHNKDDRNVMNWVTFFQSQDNINSFESSCDKYCLICVSLWMVLFVAGSITQYKLHGKHKREDYDDEIDEETETEVKQRGKKKGKKNKKKKKSKREQEDSIPSIESPKSRTEATNPAIGFSNRSVMPSYHNMPQPPPPSGNPHDPRRGSYYDSRYNNPNVNYV